MPSDDKLSWLEQLSNVLAGQSATAGAKALGTGIGYKFGGGAWSDIPDVMREAIEKHRQASVPETKNEQDLLELASGLAAVSNPISAAGHLVDFAGAVPGMVEQKIAGAEPQPYDIAQGGLKKRLAKGGAAAEFAQTNRLQRVDAKMQPFYNLVKETLPKIPESKTVQIPQENWQIGMRAFADFPSGPNFNEFLKQHNLSIGLTKDKELSFRKNPDLSNVISFPQERIRQTEQHPLARFESNPFGVRADILETLLPNISSDRPQSMTIDQYNLQKYDSPIGTYYKVKKQK